MKGSNNVAKLVVKHVILIVVMNSDTSKSSYKQTTHLLNVHPQNVAKVVHHQKLMNCSGEFFWTLSICNKRLNMLSPATKVVILVWWSYETHMSPNCKEVFKNHLAPHLYDIKLAQYLLERQVLSTISLFYSTFLV